MELIEYYRLLRRRLWIPLLLGALALLVVGLVYVLGPKRWRAEGQMLAQPGAALRVRWSGPTVDVVEEDEVWGTLEQLVESRAVAEPAATEAGIIQSGGSTSALKGLSFERSKRGNAFKVRGEAPDPAKSKQYVDAAMKKLAEFWDQTRLERARAMAADMRRQLEAQEPRRQALLTQLEAAERQSPPGKPTDLLAWTETQIIENQGAMSAAQVEVNVARDRLNTLLDMARRERALPPEQRTWAEGAVVTSPVTALSAKVADLELQRQRMLQTRTPNHPEVQALTRDLEAARQQLQAARRQEAQARDRVSPSLETQLVMARMELTAAQRRVQALQGRDAALRDRVPALQTRVRKYTDLQEQLKPLDDQRMTLLGNLKTLDSEARRLRESNDLSVVDPAQVVSSNRTLGRFAMLAVAGVAAGSIIGVLLVFLLHYLDVGASRAAVEASPA